MNIYYIQNSFEQEEAKMNIKWTENRKKRKEVSL